MPRIKAFNGYLVKPECARKVVSPAYDSLSPAQRRQFADANPLNFINTMRLQEDYPENTQPANNHLLNENQQRLHKLLHNGYFQAIETPSMFIYQLGTASHLQTGIVCEVSVEEYRNGSLRKHENTRTSKEDLLAQYQAVVEAVSSPICLTYSRSHAIDDFITSLMHATPALDFTTKDGEIQRVWQVTDELQLRYLQQLFQGIQHTYLTDGHHRAASGLRYAELAQSKHSIRDDDAPYNRLLVVLFPDNQLNLLPFHRCVKDTNRQSLEQILTALSECFDVTALGAGDVYEPTEHGEFGMLINDTWFQLRHKPTHLISNDPLDSLDVTILQRDILNPILGINDSRDDDRLSYIAGVTGDEGILQASREGWKVIFTCYATSIEQLMHVADANGLMPPKSTYFDPKPRSGIFVRLKNFRQ